MRAVIVDRWMSPEDLQVREIPEPRVTRGTLGVEVKAAGVNFFDILMVQGKYQSKPPLPFIPGGELAGIVREVGPEAEGFKAGERVMATIPTGAYAERAVVPALAAFRIPEAMSFDEGASFPIVYPTSHVGLIQRAHLRAGEWLLVHAAAGGVGIAAVQIGKALGAKVIGTAGGAEKLEVARRAGADVTIDYRKEDFVERVRAATDGKGADVIYDAVGGDVLNQSLKCIAWSGRLLVIGFASGKIPEVRANRILLKNVSLVGLHWGAYAIHEPAQIPRTIAALFELYREGKIRPLIYKNYPLEALPDALAALASRASYGKLVINP
jgi:NADPH2:quinone reductase